MINSISRVGCLRKSDHASARSTLFAYGTRTHLRTACAFVCTRLRQAGTARHFPAAVRFASCSDTTVPALHCLGAAGRRAGIATAISAATGDSGTGVNNLQHIADAFFKSAPYPRREHTKAGMPRKGRSASPRRALLRWHCRLSRASVSITPRAYALPLSSGIQRVCRSYIHNLISSLQSAVIQSVYASRSAEGKRKKQEMTARKENAITHLQRAFCTSYAHTPLHAPPRTLHCLYYRLHLACFIHRHMAAVRKA